MRSAGKPTIHETQSLQYAFAAKIDAGPNKGFALKGLLTLKGEREDDGYTEVEGRLFPDAGPLEPQPPADLEAQFDAKRKDLKAALRADINALSEELRLALANGAVPGSSEPSAAQKEALALFKAKFRQRMAEYRAALSALVAEFRAACDSRRPPGDDDDEEDERAARGYEVEGRIDAAGVITLTISLGDRGKVRATGTVGTDGIAKGTLTGPASGDLGTWTATAAVTDPSPTSPQPPAPTPPAPTPPAPHRQHRHRRHQHRQHRHRRHQHRRHRHHRHQHRRHRRRRHRRHRHRRHRHRRHRHRRHRRGLAR